MSNSKKLWQTAFFIYFRRPSFFSNSTFYSTFVLVLSLLIICCCFFLLCTGQCRNMNGQCQHICIDNKNKVTCTCYPGFSLDSDKRSCIGKYKFDVFLILTFYPSQHCLKRWIIFFFLKLQWTLCLKKVEC